MRIVAVASQKGGVGKTTVARALGDLIAERGGRCLFVDADPQGTLTADLGMRGAVPPETSLWGVLAGKTPVGDAVAPLDSGMIIPASPALQDVDAVLPSGKRRLTALRDALHRVRGCDWIVIDTPPYMGVLAWGALVASDSVVIPTVADLASVQTLTGFGRTLDAVREYSPALEIAGIVVNRWDARSLVDRAYMPQIEAIARNLGTEVLGTVRRSVAVQQCYACGESLIRDRPDHPQAVDMRAVCARALERSE